MRLAYAWILLMMVMSATAAQGLTDPTRPPPGVTEAAGASAPDATGPVLQSVMLSQGRKVAVISGEMVTLGGHYGASRLVRLTETEAVLKNGGEITVLRLYPLVEKRAAGAKKTGSGSSATTTKR